MNAPATHARGPRGDYRVGPGDLTGARAQSATEAAKDRQSTIENSVREIQDPDTQLIIVPIPGRTSSFALPRFVYDAVRAAR